MKIYTSLQDIPVRQQPTALAIGLFDGIHIGHKAVIRTALKQANAKGLESAVLTFQITEESHPVGKKGNERITSSSLFFRQLENMGVRTVYCPSFDEVRELSPAGFVKDILHEKLHASFVSCGRDFRFGKNAAGDVNQLKTFGAQAGIDVVSLPLVTLDGEVVSSSEIRSALQTGDIDKANRMLGHLYNIDFTVVHGNQIGRTLGTPTINQPYPEGYVVPKFGVYASITYIDEQMFTSVTNIGLRPTVADITHPLSETFIQNYHGDLYGQKVKVGILKFLREEIKYDTLEEMRQQMLLDSRSAEDLGTEYLKSINIQP